MLSVLLIVMLFGHVIRFIETVGDVFLVIVGAVFFAYLIYPIVRWLNKKLPLIISILAVYAVIAALVVVGLMYLIPAITNEVTTLIHTWPQLQAKLEAYVRNPNNKLFAHAPAAIREDIAHLPQTIAAWVQKNGAATVGNAFSVVVGTATFIGVCIVIPVLAAYLLFDSETIKRFFMGFIPQRRRDATLGILAELEQVIGGFIRGQLLVGASVGVIIAIGLYFVGEPYAILIGAIAAVLDFIPYIGPVIAAVPAFIIGFTSGGFPLALKVIIVFVVANQLEGHVIAPNIVSRTIQPLACRRRHRHPYRRQIVRITGLVHRGTRGSHHPRAAAAHHSGLGEPGRGKTGADPGPARQCRRGCGAVSTTATPHSIARVEIIGVPMDLGASRRGVDMGPYAVRYAKLNERLRALKISEIVDRGNLQVPLREEFEQGDHMPSITT